MLSLFPQLFDYHFYAPTILRLALAVIFFAHGWKKIKGDKAKFAEWLESMKFKPGMFWVWIFTLLEFVGGIFLLVGFLTQFIALLLAIRVLIGLVWFRRGQPFVAAYDVQGRSREFDFLILCTLFALLLLGPGAFAIDLPL